MFKFHQEKRYCEYLSQDGTTHGIWTGQACEAFGITPGTVVRQDQFDALQANRHPLTGKKLTKRKNGIRMENGKAVSNRCPYIDISFSAPKTFSILFGVGERLEVLEWHKKAVDKTLAEMEKFAARWDKRGGQKKLEVTGKFCAAKYVHLTNRSSECNVHSHVVLFNATPSGSDNFALESSELMSRCQLWTAIYRDALAAEARKAGLELETGHYAEPQIKLLTDMVPLFSQRSSDVAEMVQVVEEIIGSTLSDAERKRLVMASRGIDLIGFREKWLIERPKLELEYINQPDANRARKRLLGAAVAIVRKCSDTEPPKPWEDESLLDKWRSLLDTEQRERLQRVAGTAVPAPPRCVPVQEAVDWSVKHLFERLSVVKDWQIWTQALRYAQGANLELKELKAATREHKTLIHKAEGVTTAEHYDRECDIIQWVETGEGRGVALPATKSEELTEHQLKAVNELLKSTDQFTSLIGKAGTGKGKASGVLMHVNTKYGYRVAAMAPSTKARDVIEHEDKSTLQLFLKDTKQHAYLKRGDLVVLDEAGFASVKQVHELMELAVKNGWRICFSGDYRQHVSVDAGDALRILLSRTKLRREWLDKIIRQKPDALDGRYLRAAKLFSVGKTSEAFATLDRAGAIKVATGQDRIEQIADMIMEERKAGRSVIAVNPSHRENDMVNSACRARMKRAGQLGEERVIHAHRSLGFTLAERQDVHNLRPGLLIEVTIGKDKGKTFEVRQIDEQKNVAYGIDSTGLRMRFDKHNSEAWQTCCRRDLAVAIGDELVAHAAMKSKKGQTINGEKFTVAGFDATGAIVTNKGKVIETRNLDHAYAQTSHRCQGDTADTVIVGFDEKSLAWANAKCAYVSATRGRTKICVFTTDKSALIELENRKGDRKSSVELIKYCIDRLKRGQGVSRGVSVRS